MEFCRYWPLRYRCSTFSSWARVSSTPHVSSPAGCSVAVRGTWAPTRPLGRQPAASPSVPLELGPEDWWNGEELCHSMPLWEMMASGPCPVLGHSCPHTRWGRGRVMESRWALESSPVALTMLSSRGRSEGGALWGRRYVKKNLGWRETRGSVGQPLGT